MKLSQHIANIKQFNRRKSRDGIALIPFPVSHSRSSKVRYLSDFTALRVTCELTDIQNITTKDTTLVASVSSQWRECAEMVN